MLSSRRKQAGKVPVVESILRYSGEGEVENTAIPEILLRVDGFVQTNDDFLHHKLVGGYDRKNAGDICGRNVFSCVNSKAINPDTEQVTEVGVKNLLDMGRTGVEIR